MGGSDTEHGDGVVLVVVESKGDTAQLMAASERLEALTGATIAGRLMRVVAPTEDGIMLVELWDSWDTRMAWKNDPAHKEAVFASKMRDLVQARTERSYETTRFHLAGSGASVAAGESA